MTQKANQILAEYIKLNNLRWTQQRQTIVDVFFKAGQHLTTEELFEHVKKQDPAIGYATVSRTLHLLLEAGACSQLDISDGSMRYEAIAGHEHHDHLVCTKCGTFIEIYSPELEALQSKLVKEHDFSEQYHKLQIFGVCSQCRGSNEPA
ncbi:MAG: transcriptional repressor [Planctomycetes bacterium]|nr:transcriptional repressor [Planctomycetota bacterium]